MKNIAIITRHCYPNYGSLLQARALTDAINMLGAKAEVLDYYPKSDRPLRLAFSNMRESRLRVSWWTRLVYLAVQFPNCFIMAKRFRAFQKSYLHLTSTASTSDEMAQLSQKFDKIVSGSDQVWNTVHGKIDPAYYLHGVENSKKFSYAASFGSAKILARQNNEIAFLLSTFQNVSVRESSSQQELKKLGISAELDIDPVLLHDREYWNKFCDHSEATKKVKPYVLVYQLHHDLRFKKATIEAENEDGLKTRRVSVDLRRRLRGGASDYLVSPADFVRLFRDSQGIITDSFHGTVYGLIFGKPMTIILPSKNADRITSLLLTCGLAPYLSNLMGSDQIISLVDYDSVWFKKLIKEQTKKSLSHLLAIVSEAQK